MNRNPDRQLVFLILILVAIFLYFSIISCSSTEHRREALQLEHPDCFVMTDLTIECPDPFTISDHGAGFGSEVKTLKKKKTKGKQK